VTNRPIPWRATISCVLVGAAVCALTALVQGVGVSPVDPDKALIASYEANVLVQPERRPVLFECLSNIAIHRHRDELLHYVQTERSKGVYTLSDLMQAYARFGESGQASMQFDGDIGSNVDDTDVSLTTVTVRLQL
jgi:hypothetical protein